MTQPIKKETPELMLGPNFTVADVSAMLKIRAPKVEAEFLRREKEEMEQLRKQAAKRAQ